MGRRERRTDKRKKAIMTWLLIGIMIFSVGGILIGSNAGGPGGFDLNYEGFKFKVVDSYYSVKINDKERKFFFHPIDMFNVPVPSEAIAAFKASPVLVITFDPNSSEVETAEVSRYQLEQNLDKTIYSAVTQSSDLYNYPIVLCENATEQFPVIQLNAANITNITYNNGCLSVNSNGIDMIKITEKVIYGILGVINE